MKKRISLLLTLLIAFTLCFGGADWAFADDFEEGINIEETQNPEETGGEVPEGAVNEEPSGDIVIAPGPADEDGESEALEAPAVTSGAITADSIELTWKAVEGAEGYRVYKYSAIQKRYLRIATTSECSFKAEGLTSAKSYKFRVAAYITDRDGLIVESENFASIQRKTRPAMAVISSADAKFPAVKVSWAQTPKADGYQICYSATEDFAESKTVNVKGGDVLSKKVYKLTDATTYFFKVRAYYISSSGKKVYGEYSDVVSAAAKSTGWKTIGGKDYYYVDGAKALDMEVKIGNNAYYFDENGNKVSSSRKAWTKIKDTTSSTSWAIAVDTTNNRVCVYKKANSGWSLYRYMLCSCGANGKTYPGTFEIQDRKYGFGEPDEYSVYNATRIHDKIYFHSILYKFRTHDVVIDGRLGMNISHGCIRMSEADSLWIYNNMPRGTRVIITR